MKNVKMFHTFKINITILCFKKYVSRFIRKLN